MGPARLLRHRQSRRGGLERAGSTSARLDGYLIALDAASGKEVWRADTLVDRTRYQTITGAPQIAGGKVVIGNGGAELGVRGYITALRCAERQARLAILHSAGRSAASPSSIQSWRWRRRPGIRNSMWDVGGGGTVVGCHGVRPALDLLYVGTGNGSPHPLYSRSPKGGDNLFSVLDSRHRSGHRPPGLALPDHAWRQLGLHGHPADDPGGSRRCRA